MPSGVPIRYRHDPNRGPTLLEDAVAERHPNPVVHFHHSIVAIGELRDHLVDLGTNIADRGMNENIPQHSLHHVQVVDDRGCSQMGRHKFRGDRGGQRQFRRKGVRWLPGGELPVEPVSHDFQVPAACSQRRRRLPTAPPPQAGANATPRRTPSAWRASSRVRQAGRSQLTCTGGRTGSSCPLARQGAMPQDGSDTYRPASSSARVRSDFSTVASMASASRGTRASVG